MKVPVTAVFFVALLATTAGLSADAAQAPGAPSLERPCSFATAAEVSTMLGTSVSSAADEHFRCKYNVGSGWLETKLMDYGLKMSRDIYDYNKARGKQVPGVGDQAYVLGATLVTKLGDVVVVVDGSNLPRPADTVKLTAVAKKIVAGIP